MVDGETFCKNEKELAMKASAIMWKKNQDYASDDDVLHNIKDTAETLGCSPELVALIYFDKHLRALRRGMLGQALQSESLDERFIDSYNFLMILWSLHKEKQDITTLDKTYVCSGVLEA